MNSFSPLRSAVCVAALLSGQAAFADVTAQQVWDDWQSNMAIYGEDGITVGDTTVGDGTVTVSGFSIAMADDDVSVNAELGELVFIENGDGTVNVQLPAAYPINVVVDGSTQIGVDVSMDNASVTVSGDPGAMNYAISMDAYKFALGEIRDGDDVIEMTATLAMNDFAAAYDTSKTGDLQNLDVDATVGNIEMLMDFQDPESEDFFVMSAKVDGMTAKGGGAFPDMTQLDNPEDMFATGFDMAFDYTLGDTDMIFDMDAEGDKVTGAISQGPSTVGGVFNKDLATFASTLTDLTVQMQVPDFPMPINVSLSSYALGYEMPLSASDAPRDFGLNFSLIDLVVGDDLWSLIDPAGAVPRDPATIDIDLSGAGKLFFDLMDPEQAEAMAFADVPGELNTVDLNKLTISAAGAEVTGTGGFVFDNADLNTFGGLPRPEGELNVDIKGANALIDTLVGMGLVPEDQAMMGRMMMGMFARSTGDDQLSSKIEINAQGHVLANGQRLQ